MKRGEQISESWGDLPENTKQGGPKEAVLVVVGSEHWMVVVVLQQFVPALVSVHSVKGVTFTRQPPPPQTL